MTIGKMPGAFTRAGGDRITNLYFRNISNLKRLPREEQIELVRQAKKGSKVALDSLINCNQGAVVKIAKRYMGRGIPLLDLVQEGNQGFKRAVTKFDEKKNRSFLNYAKYWIRQAISQSFIKEGGHTARVPLSKIVLGSLVRNVQTRLFQEMGAIPTSAEIAERIRKNYSIKLKEKPTSVVFKKLSEISAKEVEEAFIQTEFPISLETPRREKDDETRTLADLIEDEKATPPDEEVSSLEMKQDINKALLPLTVNERTAVRLYFGLKGKSPKTLEEIGQRLHLSRERVRQIKEKALKKRLFYSRVLREYAGQPPKPKDKEKGNVVKAKKRVSKIV